MVKNRVKKYNNREGGVGGIDGVGGVDGVGGGVDGVGGGVDGVGGGVDGVGGGKVVIYGNSVKRVQEMAEELNCDAYYHDALNKREILKRFQEGRKQVIVATSTLGMGVDISDIRCIIHMDTPWTLLDYAQESGRAGRDGKKSEAIILWSKRAKESDIGKGEIWNEEERRYKEKQADLIKEYLQIQTQTHTQIQTQTHTQIQTQTHTQTQTQTQKNKDTDTDTGGEDL